MRRTKTNKLILIITHSLIPLAFLCYEYPLKMNVALLEVTNQNNVPRMKTLLSFGANPQYRDPDGYNLLVQNAATLSPEAAALLIQHGVNSNENTRGGMTALMVAASANNAALVRFLLQHGADVNQQTPFGGTALIDAAARNTQAACVLLDNGADVTPRNYRGETALDIARKHHNQVVIDRITATFATAEKQ